MFEGFEALEIDVGATTIFLRRAGKGQPVLLLHGFPQTHGMWHAVAPLLAQRFSVVCADLRGYGGSGCPSSSKDHVEYSKRTMAGDMVLAMERLGFRRFAVGGHDRGGRVAHRMALDHPERVAAVALLDIVPTEEVWMRADARLALAFWPWSLLAQPEPLPERLLLGAPEAVVDDAISSWGSRDSAFPHEARAAYVDALRDPAHVHAICEEYRAAATIDRSHDQSDQESGHRLDCPLLALWSKAGAVGTWYESGGGPLTLWKQWASDVNGQAMDGGHFFAEEFPEKTALLLAQHFAPRS